MGRGGDQTGTVSFTRQREDRISVIGGQPGYALIEFLPADGGKEKSIYFVSQADLDKAANQEDPVEFLTKKAIRYTYLPKAMPDIMHEIAMERVMAEDHGNFHAFLTKDPRIEFKQHGYDPERMVFINWYDHGVYRHPDEKPLTRPYLVDSHGALGEEEFDLDKAAEILEAHPWVLRVHRYEGHRHDNPDGIAFEILLPQAEHDKMSDYALRGKSKHRSKSVSPFDLKIAIVSAAKAKDLGEGHYPLGKDPLGLAPAVLAERRDWDPDRYWHD